MTHTLKKENKPMPKREKENVNNHNLSKPELKLTGQNGNAFVVLGLAKSTARKAGWSEERINEYLIKATMGDYDNLLAVTMDYFEVE